MDNQNKHISKYEHDIVPTDAYGVVKSGLERAVEANSSVALRQMEVLSMQADETEALLESGNLSDKQFKLVLKESRRIRRSMAKASRGMYVANFLLVAGFCVLLFGGGAYLRLRAA